MELLTFLLWMLIIGVTSGLYMLYSQMTYWSGKSVPYEKVTPIIGSLAPVFFRKKSFAEFIYEAYNKYKDAKYYGMMDFNTPTILVKDIDLLKDICIKNFDNNPNHKSFIDERMDPIMSKNVFSLRDERWKKVRATLSPSFTASKMKFMFNLVSKCADDFVKYLIDNPELIKSMEMKDAFTRYTNDVIATSAFGISVDSMRDRNNDFYLYGKDATSFDGIFKTFKFIFARFFPRFMKFLGFQFLSAKTDKFFKKLMHETVKMRDEKSIVRPDMIHLLMQARDNDNGISIDIDDIIAQAFIFFLAGFDTTSSHMTFLFHLLAFNKDVQDKLYDEIQSLTDNGEITYEALLKMKYMDMVMHEAMRMYPPAVVTDRVCVTPFKLPPAMPGCKEIIVERDTIFWIPIYGIHMDPNYFPQPDKFDPERFNDDNKDNILPNTLIGFGLGPRKCIGERFAVMETKIIIAKILKKFIINPTDKTKEKIVFDKASFNIKNEGGVWLNFELRK
ncbi:cytochrome P450 9e2-like [Aphidius gifuensis]|uniref:cytochrome P450 9e2-like n=1 Tax=Aphidius gifuensis TaxID=684658 RepID=UPI001CDC18D6|nr:cytochrome P450 9e2-like [Aphidius gifuensis]